MPAEVRKATADDGHRQPRFKSTDAAVASVELKGEGLEIPRAVTFATHGPAFIDHGGLSSRLTLASRRGYGSLEQLAS